MSIFKHLPRHILILNWSRGVWIVPSEAVFLLREKRAREVYRDGEFIGIELGVYGPPSKAEEFSPLPPAELPGLYYEDVNPERRYARFHWNYA